MKTELGALSKYVAAYIYHMCLIHRNHICIWADLFRENLHHDGGWTHSWCHPSGCGRCFPNYQKCNNRLICTVSSFIMNLFWLLLSFCSVSKERVPSQGFLHGNLQWNCDRSARWHLEKETSGSPRDYQRMWDGRNCRYKWIKQHHSMWSW